MLKGDCFGQKTVDTSTGRKEGALADLQETWQVGEASVHTIVAYWNTQVVRAGHLHGIVEGLLLLAGPAAVGEPVGGERQYALDLAGG